MSSQQLLIDSSLALNSSKKKERLSALESISHMLNQDSVVLNLSKSDSEINWSILFTRVHNGALSIIEEGSARQVCNKNLQLIQNVVCEIVQKSFCQKCFVNPSLIASSVLSVFESAVRIKYLGCVYLNMFHKYVMAEKKNWSVLKEEHWIGLKNICISYFKNPPAKVQSSFFLELLIDIVRFSPKICQVSHNFLDLFTFIENAYEHNNDLLSEKILIHLTNTLCLQLAVEFRFKVCEFMEKVFDYIIHSHKKKNSSIMTLVYHFLTATINIHNPNGLWDEKTFYAHNVVTWKSQVREIYFLCWDNIKLTLKTQSDVENEDELLNLLLDSSHLLWSCDEYNCDNLNNDVNLCQPGPAKKRKYSSNTVNSNFLNVNQVKLENSLNELLENLNGGDCYFWLKFLELLIVKHPLSLKHKYHQILEFLHGFISEPKDIQNKKIAMRCMCNLLEVESSIIKELGDGNIQPQDDLWNKISSDLIRFISIEVLPETHVLMRSLLSKSKLQDPEPLIKLYCSETLQQDFESFKTLCVLCQHCILPEVLITSKSFKNKQENYATVKEKLLNWLFQGDQKFPCQDLAKVLIALIIKKFEEDVVTSTSKDNAIISKININDFCQLITQNYLTLAFKNLHFIESKTVSDNTFEIRVESNMKQKLFRNLQIKQQNLNNLLKNDALIFLDQVKALEDCLWFSELICHILSHFESSPNSTEVCTFLTGILKSLLPLCTMKALDLIKFKFFDLSCFSKFYSSNFHVQIHNKIRTSDFINLGFLQYAFELFEKYLLENDDSVPSIDNLNSVSRFSKLIKNSKSILHFETLSKREKLVVNIIEMLCHFIAVPYSSNANSYQTVLALKILKTLIFEDGVIRNDFYLQLVLRVIYSFTRYDGMTLPVLNDCLELMEKIFKTESIDFEVLITALQVLKELVPVTQRLADANTHLKYKKILEELKTLINNKVCGHKAVCKFIECIAEICKLDLEGNWDLSDGASSSVLEELIEFLKHPYLEIKLMAAKHVGLLFVCNKNAKIVAWQRRMFKNLFVVLKNETSMKENNYFISVSSSISMMSWASVVCLSPYWRKKALFYLIYAAFLKNIKSEVVQDILTLICQELKISKKIDYVLCNFSYLIRKWTKKKLEIQNFPYYLLGYTTAHDFVINHFPHIVTVYSIYYNLDIVYKLSKKLNKPVAHLLKQCHSELLAFILPAFNESANDKKCQKAQELKRFIDKEIGAQTSVQWLTEFLDEVVFNILRNMHDPMYLSTLSEFSGNIKNDKNPLGFNAAQVMKSLETLGSNEGKPLLSKLAEDMPSVIQKILQLLLENVESAIIREEKIFAFYKYIFFVELVSNATRRGSQYRNINTYIIRDTVNNLAAIIKYTEDEVLLNMACECYRKLGDSFLEQFHCIIGDFLSTIMTPLANAAKRGNKKALEVIGFFICKNYEKLKRYIKFLYWFPSEDFFFEINDRIKSTETDERTLRNTIKHFISSKNVGYCVEGLKNLQEKLSDNKLELKEMYEELRLLRGFSEDCKDSLLHQLICILVELTFDKNFEVKIGASKCLGELGPSDLTTLVLRPESNFIVSKSKESPIHRLLKSAIRILSDLIVNDNFKVKKASSKALYAILSTKQGRDIVQDLKESLENVVFLTPFVSKSGGNLELQIKKDVFLSKFEKRQFWTSNKHEEWIVELMKDLLLSFSDSSGVINTFLDLIQVNWQFAEKIFPMYLDFVLSLKESICNEKVNIYINEFFEKYFSLKNKYSVTMNKSSVRCILNAVDYIRMQENIEGVYQRFCLEINYLYIAKAALYCSAYFTSIFYAELWYQDKTQNSNTNMDLNLICEIYPEEGFSLTEILRKCHFEIGNFDGIHGCGYMHILNSTSEIEHFEHLKNWNLSVLYRDIQLSQGLVESEASLFHSLEQSGVCYVVNRLIKSQPETPELTGIQYKCAAKLSDWSHVDSTYKKNNNASFSCFDKCYYFALKAFHYEDEATFQNENLKARRTIFHELAHCSLESSKNLYLPLTELQCLKELEEFCRVVNNVNINELVNLFEKWEQQDSIKCTEFKFVESVLTNRIIIIQDSWKKARDNEISECLQSMLCRIYNKLTVAARKEKNYETAFRTLSYFNSINNPPKDIAGKMKVEKARIMWERGDREIGRFLLSHLLKKNEITEELRLKCLRIYGDWMAKTKSENSREIIENYYLKSISQMTKVSEKIHSYASIAALAYSMYEQFNEYLSSPLFEIKRNLVNTQQDLASELRQELGWKQSREKRMAYQIAAKQSAIDQNEIKNCKTERDTYLTLAIKYYLLTLKEGEKYNLIIFRVVSLWLSNSSNPEVIQELQKLLHHIPTYKFLCLLPQLVPRMPDVCLISDLIERILQDHPYHTLPLLFALKNSYEDLKYTDFEITSTNPRVLTSSTMIKKFETHKYLGALICETRRFSSALIELANYNPSDQHKSGTPIKFPENLQINRISNLAHVPVPSLQIPYNKNCVYDNIIGVRKFESTYYLVGGINLPKRITCIGTDGKERSLLVKGKDDLRQDAVMQQVFTIMNSLLYQNSDTSKRKLVIRTYKVAPLSQRSGVIEWCEKTQPLSLYLTGNDGKSGAHKRYFPQDTSAYDCRCLVRKVFAQPQVSNEEKLRVFLDICKQIHPVFHYFFIEKFPAAGIWFERRLAYIHSVATSSMIGYILGIGDRHVHNILVDNSTAEVIHIDLGIAFEQGKTLPTPETVPFRLTRDIVDGMGSFGVEGDFRISCIKTMEVLRENQDTILTLLEVLLYDPLYTWTITPEKAYFIQNHTESSSTTTEKSSPDPETNKMAERALIRLKQKLQGTEAGFGATTVEGQVRILINEARDPNNLCRLFHGWQAFL